MPRLPRPRFAGALYHIGARGNRRQQIFSCATDYRRFLAILAFVVERFGWRCHTYCLMPNQFHLLVETPEPNISEGMQPSTARTRNGSTCVTATTATSSRAATS